MWLPAVALCASLHLACFSVLIHWQPHPLSFVSVAFGVMGLSCSLLVLLPGLRRVLQRKATAINAPSRTRAQWAEASPLSKPSHDTPDFRCRSVSFMGSTHMLCNALEEPVQEDAAAREPAPLSRARPGLGTLCATSAFIATDFLWATCGVHSFWILIVLPRKAVRRLLFCVVVLLPSIHCVAMRAFGLSVFPQALHPVELCIFQGGNVILPIFMPLMGLYPQSESRVQKRGRRASRHIPSSESTLGMVQNMSSSGSLVNDSSTCSALRLNPATRRRPLRYNVANLIGRGGFAKVYLGMCLNTGELICIKQLAHGYQEADIQAVESEVALVFIKAFVPRRRQTACPKDLLVRG